MVRSPLATAIRRATLAGVALGAVVGVLACLWFVGSWSHAQEDRSAAVTIEFSNRYQFVAPGVQVFNALAGTPRAWIIHTDLVLDDGRLLGATPGGVRVRAWTRPLRYERYTLAVTPDEKARIYAYAEAQVGKPYGFGNLFLFPILRGRGGGEGAFICSELVARAVHAGGYDLTDKRPDGVTPAELAASPLLTKITGEAE